MVGTCRAREREPWTPSCRVKLRGQRSRGRPVRQWLDDVKEWTGLSSNEIWRKPEERVARRKHVSQVAKSTQ